MEPLELCYVLGAQRLPCFSRKRIDDQSAAHADPPVNAPIRQLDACFLKRLPPGKNMLINTVDQRTIEIEQKRRTSMMYRRLFFILHRLFRFTALAASACLLLRAARVRCLEFRNLLIILRQRRTAVPLSANKVELHRGLMATHTRHAIVIGHPVSPGDDEGPRSETVNEKNSQPFVRGNFSDGCLTIAWSGKSCRTVPTG